MDACEPRSKLSRGTRRMHLASTRVAAPKGVTEAGKQPPHGRFGLISGLVHLMPSQRTLRIQGLGTMMKPRFTPL